MVLKKYKYIICLCFLSIFLNIGFLLMNHGLAYNNNNNLIEKKYTSFLKVLSNNNLAERYNKFSNIEQSFVKNVINDKTSNLYISPTVSRSPERLQVSRGTYDSMVRCRDLIINKKEDTKNKEDENTRFIKITAVGKFSYDELSKVARMVEAEAGDEPYIGKIAVAYVIKNRLVEYRTIENTLFADNQFSPVKDGRYYKVRVTQDSIDATMKVFKGLVKDPTYGATYFMNPTISSKIGRDWQYNYLKETITIGHHRFAK